MSYSLQPFFLLNFLTIQTFDENPCPAISNHLRTTTYEIPSRELWNVKEVLAISIKCVNYENLPRLLGHTVYPGEGNSREEGPARKGAQEVAECWKERLMIRLIFI